MASTEVVPQSETQPSTNAAQSGPTGTRVRVTESQLAQLLAASSDNAALQSLFSRILPKNISVLHPSDYQEEPLNEDLVRRVQSLQADVENTASIVAKRRKEAVARIEEQACAAHADIANVPPPAARSLPEKRVYPPPLPVAAVLGKAVARAKDTRKRAGRVRQVLKMLSENVEDRGDVSCTIGADWSDTFEDLSKACSRKDPEHVSSISPFVTPRSKTRRRVARFAGQMRRLELPR